MELKINHWYLDSAGRKILYYNRTDTYMLFDVDNDLSTAEVFNFDGSHRYGDYERIMGEYYEL